MAFISVIIPTYNRSAYLAKAIDSVLAQDAADLQLVVVDDGSSDGTAELVRDYGTAVTYCYQANKGPAAARNQGIKLAQGDYIAFLDSDDWWHEDKLSRQVAAMESEPGYLISHTDEVWYRRGKLLNQKKIHARPHGHIFHHCLPLCCVGMSTVVVRRSFFDWVGLFAEEFPCCEDYELWLRASARLPFLKIDHPLTFKQGGRPDQVSQQYRIGMDRFRIMAMLKTMAQEQLSLEQQQLLSLELCRKGRIFGEGCLKHGRQSQGEQYLDMVHHFDKHGPDPLAAGKFIDSFSGKSDD